MAVTRIRKRFVPCPYCKGAGGHTEIVCEAGGPYYSCYACGGSGDCHDYVIIRDERRAQWEANSQVMCDCGHDAAEHYDDYGLDDSCGHQCAANLAEIEHGFDPCPCRRSHQDVIRGIYPKIENYVVIGKW